MIFILLFVFLVLYLYWINRKLFQANEPFRQHFVLPFFGNGYYFLCKDEEILDRIGYMIKSEKSNYYKPLVFWLGSTMFLIFTDPNQFEKLFVSVKLTHKSIFYKVAQPHVGEGLITGSGPNYKKHKKAIQPLLDSNFNQQCYGIFNEKLNLCMDRMKNNCTGKYFNMCSEVLRDGVMGFVASVILGVEYDPVRDKQFVDDNEHMYFFLMKRIFRPWLYIDFLYKMTELYSDEHALIMRNRSFVKRAIAESRRRISSNNVAGNKMEPLIDQLARIVQEKPDLMDQEEFCDHILTLHLAGYDPTYMTIAFCCLMLGMYPECQKKLAEELRDHFGTVPKNASIEDLEHLPYLDMCIKETLRIQPIGPLISRSNTEDYMFENTTIPKDTQIAIPAFYVHRDPKFWENPDCFYPEHFLPENVAKRPLHAYLPFSAGVRACIGRLLAKTYIRLFVASFIQKFEVEADGKLQDIKFKMDISARPIQGYNIKIKERLWK